MIHLVENYFMDSDDRNVILFRKSGERTDKDGNLKVVGEYFYYSDIQAMLTGLYKRLQRSQMQWSSSLEDLKTRLEAIGFIIEEIGQRLTR